MLNVTGRMWVILVGVFGVVQLSAQTLNNQSLTGKYYFRHLSLGTDGVSPGSLSDPRTLTGIITFDGNGRYGITGQILTGVNAPVSLTGAGTYALDPGGFLVLDSPLRTGQKVNARFGPEAIVGSTTESSDAAYDFFVAVPAPASGAAFTGPYHCMTLEFPGGVTSGMRSAQFPLAQASPGLLQTLAVYGHAASISQGKPFTQQVSGATYTLLGDGSGTLTAGAVNSAQLLSGSRVLYVSANGNLVIGGSSAAGGHDILLGVKAMAGVSNATWNATFFAAGLRVDPTATAGYAGALAARGKAKLTWTKRYKALGTGAFHYTGVNNYALTADGTGTVDYSQVALGDAGNAFVGATISVNDPLAYEIYFGVQTPALSGTGVFLNPLGVINAASFAPPGNPIAPGQFISLFGTGLARSNQTATPPYPPTLNGVTVLINNKQAPIYFVSSGQLNVLVPFSTTGPTATIVVQNSGANSNTVTVPVAATSPGVYALDQSGSGNGAILHADYSLVNAAKPAIAGETVLIFLTGLGTLTPSLTDGTAGNSSTFYRADTDLTVYVGGQPGNVSFKGQAPGFPGLYQVNVTLPQFLRASGNLPLALQTSTAYHDQVDIPIL
ncbi:MAG: hypothetical protein ABI759_22535 [Candidatus Solibacter sp.]